MIINENDRLSLLSTFIYEISCCFELKKLIKKNVQESMIINNLISNVKILVLLFISFFFYHKGSNKKQLNIRRNLIKYNY